MAKLSKLEFAAKCGINTREFSVYLSRGKIILMDSGEIDDTDSKNIAFATKRAAKAVLKNRPVEQKQELNTSDGHRGGGPELDEYSKLELEKLKQTVEKLKNENRKIKLNNEKTVGIFVPVDHVVLLMVQLSEAVHLAWENEFEDVIVGIAGRYGLSREEITQLKKQKIDSSNISRERAVKEAKKQLRRLQNETSDSKGVGEHG